MAGHDLTATVTTAFDSGDARSHVSLRWLIRVRWGAAIGQVATILIAHWALGFTLPLAPLFAIVVLSAATNMAAGRLLRRDAIAARGAAGGPVRGTVRGAARGPTPGETPGEARDAGGSARGAAATGGAAGAATRGATAEATGRLAGSLLAIDTLLLTVSLALTGGPLNPFSVVYLVYITLAAVVLGARWTWFLTVLAACGYGSLFLHALQALPAGEHGDHQAIGLSSHLQGMWWAFVLAASLTAYFVVKLSSAIERRDHELARMREQAMRSERLASLTTLAAGAAHELSTPLATIAVVAGEMERELERGRDDVVREGALRAGAPRAGQPLDGVLRDDTVREEALRAGRARAGQPLDGALRDDMVREDALRAGGPRAGQPPDGVLRDDIVRAGALRDDVLRAAPVDARSMRASLLADARLIRAELQRCRSILDRMAAQAGETAGEMPLPVSVSALVADALRALPPDDAARVRVEAPETVATLTVPGRGVVTALVSLLRNAIDASTQPVMLAAAADAGVVRLTVRDWGAGMAPDVLARAGEPFFSTKPAGVGMGLGLFLTRALAERLGGALHLESTLGAGTAATLELPVGVPSRQPSSRARGEGTGSRASEDVATRRTGSPSPRFWGEGGGSGPSEDVATRRTDSPSPRVQGEGRGEGSPASAVPGSGGGR